MIGPVSMYWRDQPFASNSAHSETAPTPCATAASLKCWSRSARLTAESGTRAPRQVVTLTLNGEALVRQVIERLLSEPRRQGLR